MNDSDGNADDASAHDEESQTGDHPKNQGKSLHAIDGIGLGFRIAVVRPFDDVIDQGAVRRIGRADILVRLLRRCHVGLRQRRQQHIVDGDPKPLDLAVGFQGELRFDGGIKIRFQPEVMPLVIFFFQLNETVAVHR